MLNRLGYKQRVAIVYTIALFLDRLDLTIVNIILPTISKAFKVPMVATDWVSLAFLIALTLSIPISSWLGEHFGLKRMFIISLVLFGFGSSLCSVSPGLYFLVFFRFIQGIGGGMIIPLGLTILYSVYEKSEYASITSFTFLPSLLAPAIAPVIGGVVLETIGWRYVFLFSGPICLVLAISSFFILKEHDLCREKPLDWLGFAAISLLLMDLFITFSFLSRQGFSDASMVGILLILPLLLFFLLRERRCEHPLINLNYFKNSIFVKINLVQLCFQACHFGAIFLVGMFLQIGIGLSAIYAGCILGSQAVGAMVTSRYSVKLFNTISQRFPIMVGLSGIAVLSPLTLLLHGSHIVLFGMILFFFRGIFSGLCGTPIQALSVISFDKKEINTVNVIFNICRQVSISFGVAISSILIAFGMKQVNIPSSSAMLMHDAIAIFKYGFFAIVVLSLAGVLIVWTIKPLSEFN